jgi:hypothetical protein
MKSIATRNDSAEIEAQRAWLFLAISVGVTLALFYVPYGHTLGFPLVLMSTVAHELGHGIAALLVGGSFESMYIHADASGLAYTGGYDGRFARAIVAAGGLVGPACAATIAFALAKRARSAQIGLVVIGALIALAVPLVVRNLFGAVYMLALAGVLLGIGLKARASIAQLTLLFVAVQLALSVFSRGDYLFMGNAVVDGVKRTSDVGAMADALFLPYWFWGGVCGLFSLVVLVVGAILFVRAPGVAKKKRPSLTTPRTSAL